MPTKKRQPFYFFMVEMQKKHREKGTKYSLREMPAIAAPFWAKMTKEEKAKYEAQSKRYNEDRSGSSDIKTCHGIAYREVEQEKRRAAEESRKMKEEVRQLINTAILAQNLSSKMYYVIHINYFCESRDSNGEVRYDAAELAILDFSLEDGVKHGMHTVIRLDELPYGYTFEASYHTEKTHMLPLPPKTIGCSTIDDAVEEVLRFINMDEDVCPPIFTSDLDLPIVRSVFREVLQRLPTKHHDVRIYSLSELLFNLKNVTHGQTASAVTQPPFASVYLAECYLARGTFDFAEGLPCQFHQEVDRVTHCSQTKVKGWAFSVIHSCAPDLGIQFVEGKHEPESAMSEPTYVKPQDESFTSVAGLMSEADRLKYFSILPSTDTSFLDNFKDLSIANTINTDDFPLLRDFKRGKGRGNLV
ncbi:protein maelstrom homolog [Lutzomyia longipalpis]|uniref:protein maelstrom homolog n=1 Tax=Lutzomyia longipalpis TaxID=7200 RepID=UPI0024840733|nr:protein maelstrom homolog [Lutzomyia longipalpis]